MGFSLRMGAGPVGGGRRNSPVRIRQRRGSRLVRIPLHGGGKFPARWNDSGKIQRGDTLVGNAGDRRISYEHRGIWLDQWGISDAVAPTAGAFRHAFGRGAESEAGNRTLKLLPTDRSANLLKIELIAWWSRPDLAGHPGPHAIRCFIQSGDGSVTQVVVHERGGKGITRSHRIGNVDAKAGMLADFVGTHQQAALGT